MAAKMKEVIIEEKEVEEKSCRWLGLSGRWGEKVGQSDRGTGHGGARRGLGLAR